VGGKVLFASDEWFASATNMIQAHTAEWREGVFSDFGKWMDGWYVD
jgi:allantoicase